LEKDREEINREPTEAQVEGTKAQFERSESKFVEMRGIYKEYKDALVFMSFDEIDTTGNKARFIEHKNVHDINKLEDWFVEYSVLQVAFYAAMAESIDHYTTATFHVKNGNEKNNIFVDKDREFYLYMKSRNGELIIKVDVLDPKKILDLYKKKVKVLKFDKESNKKEVWDKAQEFDSKYKRKEVEHLSGAYEHKIVSDIKYNATQPLWPD
jgi:hypothetical protein